MPPRRKMPTFPTSTGMLRDIHAAAVAGRQAINTEANTAAPATVAKRKASSMLANDRHQSQEQARIVDATAVHQHHSNVNGHAPFHDGGPRQGASKAAVSTVSTTDASLECLHCHSQTIPSNIQVRCDECSACICNNCHWCHEYQANHEIRVCDRCDAFYCRQCDEMDQCDDCAEVVCANCSTLLSCKFCGGGLCEDCATACGRCGIVLCSRDAKFAVDCDTCRLSYCLVCLASGSKDPCVRCGHRPSKRMEQLVHLRLKSIYKAFKQSSHSMRVSTAAAAAAWSQQQDDIGDAVPILAAAAAAADDPEGLLQTAVLSTRNSSSARLGRHSQQQRLPIQQNVLELPVESAQDTMEVYMAKVEKADAVAAELLAELEEEEAAKKKKKNKKKKEKKKKQQQQQQDVEKERASDEIITTRTEDIFAKVCLDKPVETHNTSMTIDAQASSTPLSIQIIESTLQTTHSTEQIGREEEKNGEPDPMDQLLCKLIADNNIEGLESFLSSLKGVPGKAVLRKNAKKALKRLRSADDEQEKLEFEFEGEPISHGRAGAKTPVEIGANRMSDLLKVVSYSNGKPPSHISNTAQRRGASVARFECVMHMAPAIVGWVIGKGGQRIRDLMEESGARIWIDQESMSVSEPRIVYISGARKSVETAMKMVTDLVKKAPVGTPSSKQMTPIIDEDPVQLPSKTPTFPDEEISSGKAINLHPRIRQQAPVQLATTSPVTENHVQVVTCDPRFVPLLIGRRGWTIKNIQDSSGAKVDIDQTVNPRQISISGSAGQVAVAVKMVKDVLDYPKSQLLGAPEAGSDVEGEQKHFTASHMLVVSNSAGEDKAQSAHPSPPSSLIMPIDTVSASSSLSSTPEPSMASSSTRGPYYPQLPPETLLPPRLVSQPAVELDVLQHAPLPSDLLTPGRPIPQSNMQNITRCTGPASNDIIGRPQMVLPNYPSAVGEYTEHEQARKAVPDQMNQMFSSGPSSHVLHPEYSTTSPHVHMTPAVGDSSWQLGAPSVPANPTGGFSLDAAVDFLQHSTIPSLAPSFSGIGLPPMTAGQSRLVNHALPASFDHPVGATSESLIVDSLFGPSETIEEGSRLLTGLEGLSINREHVGGAGLWGAPIAEDPTAPERDSLSGFKTERNPSIELFEPHSQHPAQSRFGW